MIENEDWLGKYITFDRNNGYIKVYLSDGYIDYIKDGKRYSSCPVGLNDITIDELKSVEDME